MGLVSGKVALVTGSGAGIGRAAALKFAEEGAKVFVSDVNSDGGNETVALINKRAETLLLRERTWRELPTSLLSSQSSWTHTAGSIAPATMQALKARSPLSLNKWSRILMRSCPSMPRVPLNLASVAGLIGFPGLGAYVASKHAINGLTKNAALEYSKMGVRVNSICPGGIETRMLDLLVAQSSKGQVGTHEMMDPLHPIGRIGTPR